MNSTETSRVVPELGERFDVVFAGNLGTAQSLETILDAASLLQAEPDIRIFIVGTGRRIGWLKEQVDARGLANVILTGQFDPVHMPSIYSRASVLLGTLRDHPNYNLTIPTKVQAYLAAGRPIVLCMNGASAALLKQARAGISCAAEDASALAQAILAMKRLSASERIAMGDCGKAFYQDNFEPHAQAKKMLAHFESLVLAKARLDPAVSSQVGDTQQSPQ